MDELDIPAELLAEVSTLRSNLERGFSQETALLGSKGVGPSGGQCAATAIVVKSVLGGEFVSTRIQGESHWFNRLAKKNVYFDIDITGDQFGFPKVQIRPAGELYPNTRVRSPSEVNHETKRRAIILAERAHIKLK